MDPVDTEPFTIVYRGFDPTEAGMLARLLEAEGITCRHIGTQNPAYIGVGELGCEQRLEVPQHEEARARELLDSVELQGEPVSDSDG